MSEEDVEIVRRAYAAFNRGDRDGAVADVTLDAEYIPSEAFPESRVRRGPEDVKNFMSWLWDEFEDARLDTHEFIDLGDKVLVSMTIRARGRQSGAEASWDVRHIWEIGDGKVMRCQAFMSADQAREAAGLL
jgi:ketosteroid isomerase-like protein